MKRALDSTTQTGLRQRIRHRLRARDTMVTPKERAFIESIDDLLTQGNILSGKRSDGCWTSSTEPKATKGSVMKEIKIRVNQIGDWYTVTIRASIRQDLAYRREPGAALRSIFQNTRLFCAGVKPWMRSLSSEESK